MSAMEVTEKLADATGQFEADLAKYPILNFLEQKTHVPRTAIVVGAALSLFTFVYAAFGPALLCNLVGFVYPVYASFQAIETKRTDDDTQWLTYWVVYATFTVMESFVELILFWFPFYYSFKFGFLLWMFMPNTQGAKFLYDSFVRPLFMEADSRLFQLTSKRRKSKKLDVDDEDEIKIKAE